MGAYMSTPKTEKDNDEGKILDFPYCSAEMQGWRIDMEDACMKTAVESGGAFFGVFDGHGGREVSLYVAKHLPRYFAEAEALKKEDYGEALVDAFLRLDASLEEQDAQDELTTLMKNDDDEAEFDTEDLQQLVEENDMNITTVLEQYGIDLRQMTDGDAQVGEEDEEDDSDDEDYDPTKKKEQSKDGKESTATSADNDKETSSEKEGDAQEDPEGDNCDDEKKNYAKRTKKWEAFWKKAEMEESSEEQDTEEDEEADSDEDDIHALQRQAMQQTGPGVSSGTTATVAYIINERVIVANAGDTRCVLCRNGEALDLSEDHKPEDEIESNRITRAGGMVKEGRIMEGLNLSRALGDHGYKRNRSLPPDEQMVSPKPDITVTPLEKSDEFLLLACDGIWNSMESKEAIEFVRTKLQAGVSLRDTCNQLCDACMASEQFAEDSDGSGMDNETVLIVLLNGFYSGSITKPQPQKTKTKRKKTKNTDDEEGQSAQEAKKVKPEEPDFLKTTPI